jgi:hypothetical protein
MTAKGFDTGRVAQIQAENFQAVAPVREVRLRGVTHGRVARKTGGHNEMHAGAQQFDACLVADFHAPAGEQRHASAQVGQFGPLAPVQFRARRAKLVVEMMEL